MQHNPYPHTRSKEERSKPFLEEQYTRAPTLTSAIALATLAETHSRVNSKDCQDPDCCHVSLHCHDQAHHGPQPAHFARSPMYTPASGAALCSAVSRPVPSSAPCWHWLIVQASWIAGTCLMIDPWRVNLNGCCQHLCSAWEQKDWAVPTRIVPFPSCQLPIRQPGSFCFLMKAPIFIRETYSCWIEVDLQFHLNLVELPSVKEGEEGENGEVTHTSLYIINYLVFTFLSQKLHCQKHPKH